jgi:hypothetical protein
LAEYFAIGWFVSEAFLFAAGLLPLVKRQGPEGTTCRADSPLAELASVTVLLSTLF